MKEITKCFIDDFMKKNPELEYLKSSIIDAVSLIVSLKPENKVLICGNGGSAADSEHIAGELLKSFTLKRRIDRDFATRLKQDYNEEGEFIADNLQKAVKAIPLTSFCAYNTAFLNDCNEKMLFAQLVNALGIKNDVLIAISTSGNSKNVVYAAKVAKTMGIKVISLTGESGGILKAISDVIINVPSNITYKIQEYHLPIYHLLCLCIENELFDC